MWLPRSFFFPYIKNFDPFHISLLFLKANEQRYMNYQDELEKKQREQKREEYIQLLEEERRQKEHEKAEIIKELVKKKISFSFYSLLLCKKKKEKKEKGITENKKTLHVLQRLHPTNQHKLFLPPVNQLH